MSLTILIKSSVSAAYPKMISLHFIKQAFKLILLMYGLNTLNLDDHACCWSHYKLHL